MDRLGSDCGDDVDDLHKPSKVRSDNAALQNAVIAAGGRRLSSSILAT